MNRQKLDEIIVLVSSLLANGGDEYMGMECIEAEWVASDRILRLYIDIVAADCATGEVSPTATDSSTESSVTERINLDQCVKASRLFSEHPEIDALIQGAFTLEVSSPGIERPLRTSQHFLKYVGNDVRVKLVEKVQDRRNGAGKLVDVAADVASQDTNITLATAEGRWSFPLSSLQRASLIYDWGGV